jgi:LPXTG-motif cell wall-anchored protein
VPYIEQVTRIKSRFFAALLAIAAIVAGSIAMAAPASASPTPSATFVWQVEIGTTWTTLTFGHNAGVNVPSGVHPSRIIISNTTTGDDATVSEAWAGSSNYNNTGTQGTQLSDCAGYVGTPLPVPSNSSLTCTSTYNFIAGNRYELYGFTLQFAVGGQYQLGNQEVDYVGISDDTTGTVEATDANSTYLGGADAGLQTLPAGYVPNVRFSFSNSGASEDITGVTYSSAGTASIATACPGLTTTWSHSGTASSGQCVVAAANPATTTPQTITITAVGTGSFGAVTTTQSFTYAATPATCTTSATTYNPGGTGTITCSGFQPNITVVVTLHSSPVTLGTVSTGAGGTFTFSFVIPKTTLAGAHTISIDSAGTALVTSDPITVGLLAETGVNVAGPIGAAVALLMLGGALVFLRRRRAHI